jgi:hypothetical protein
MPTSCFGNTFAWVDRDPVHSAAIDAGVQFAFEEHFAPEYLFAQLYREHFEPSEVLRKPYLMVAVQLIAGDGCGSAAIVPVRVRGKSLKRW